MNKAALIVATGVALSLSGLAHAQKGPNIKEMKPGKYAYTIEMNNPALPFKMPAMNFQQCVSAKDMDEGKAFQSQKDAGVDCTYTNVKASPGSFAFLATCKMKGGMTMEADYDGKIAGDTVTMNVKQKMTGGDIPDQMRNSTMKMVMTRQGDC
ncbi:MAG: DUF3617 family protein [Betaproteobacteria bacterium]|nr:DUF3617 family protein [Betaproteobacteria bacterium]